MLNIIWNYGFTALCKDLQLNSCNAVSEQYIKDIYKGCTNINNKYNAGNSYVNFLAQFYFTITLIDKPQTMFEFD